MPAKLYTIPADGPHTHHRQRVFPRYLHYGNSKGMASGAAIRRLWRPTHRWLAGWVAAWTLGGAGIWLMIWVRHEALTPTEMFLNSGAMWLLFGLALALVCSATPPWSRHE